LVARQLSLGNQTHEKKNIRMEILTG